MSLCYTEIKNQVKGLSEYKKKHVQFDSMVLLKSFRKIVYTGGSNNLHINHNKAMSPANFMSLYQEHFQGGMANPTQRTDEDGTWFSWRGASDDYFLYKEDKKKYGTLLEEVENDMLQGKYLFPKSMSFISWILAGCTSYGSKSNRFSEANDRVAFTSTLLRETRRRL